MEDRKQKEIAYYDEAAQHELAEMDESFEGFVPSPLGSYRFLYKIAASLCKDKKVLDYGCGNGVHSGFLAKHAREVVGVDLSEGALAVAKKAHEKIGDRASFMVMDCEQLEFPDQSFDVIFDGGTFSSLDFEKAMNEITRVLQADGVLVGIETFGHNPLANAKRALNRFIGKRTAWAAAHIVTKKEIEALSRYFDQVEVRYFHLASLFVFPFLSLPGGGFVLQLAELIDSVLLRLSFLRKYAFKVVFVCKNPKYGKKDI